MSNITRRSSRRHVVVVYLAAFTAAGCGLPVSEQLARIETLQATLADVDSIRVDFYMEPASMARTLDEYAAKRFKSAFLSKNLELVPNSHKRSADAHIELLCDSSKRGDIVVFKQGVYSYNGVCFRLRNDDISTMLDSLARQGGTLDDVQPVGK